MITDLIRSGDITKYKHYTFAKDLFSILGVFIGVEILIFIIVSFSFWTSPSEIFDIYGKWLYMLIRIDMIIATYISFIINRRSHEKEIEKAKKRT